MLAITTVLALAYSVTQVRWGRAAPGLTGAGRPLPSGPESELSVQWLRL